MYLFPGKNLDLPPTYQNYGLDTSVIRTYSVSALRPSPKTQPPSLIRKTVCSARHWTATAQEKFKVISLGVTVPRKKSRGGVS